MSATRYASALAQKICLGIGNTGNWGQTEVFLCAAERRVSRQSATGGHDPEPSPDQTGPLCGGEERCSQRHFRYHVQWQIQEGTSVKQYKVLEDLAKM